MTAGPAPRGGGRLLLVPNLLGTVAPEAVLPAATIAAARGVAHWVVETPKAARAFLKTLGMGQPIHAIAVAPLSEARSGEDLRRLLAPAAAGHDVGLLSDAGCPGVADPGAALVAAAHDAGVAVVPLVGPSAILLALMASGMNGQRFAFHGYLPVAPEARAAALRTLESESRAQRCTQVFIETPYRNVAMIEALRATLKPATRLCVACELTLPSETVISRPVAKWRSVDSAAYAKRPAIFLLLAS